jgi:cardiolipin synthase
MTSHPEVPGGSAARVDQRSGTPARDPRNDTSVGIDADEPRDRGLWTIPNLISLLRLLAVPWFLWLLLHEDEPIAAGILLAVLGATDWVDGYIARHFDQGSKIGKIMDPIADRVLLIAGAVGLLIDGTAPRWVLVLVLAREVVVSIGTVWLAALGARRIDVQWVGKAGTLAVMFALPLFLWLDNTSPGTGHDVLAVITWGFTIGGLILSYYALLGYIPIAREALREGRAGRTAVTGGRA